MVMSLKCPVGPEHNLLDVSPEHCARMVVEHPIVSLADMQALKDSSYKNWNTHVIDCTIPFNSSSQVMVDILSPICEIATEAIKGNYGGCGAKALVSSDRMTGPDRLFIPSFLVVGAVHQHLIRTKQLPKAAIFVEFSDANEVHDFFTLLGYGTDGVFPYLAYESLAYMNETGIFSSRAKQEYTKDELFYSNRKAAAIFIISFGIFAGLKFNEFSDLFIR